MIEITRHTVTAKMWKIFLTLTLLTAVTAQEVTVTQDNSTKPQTMYLWGLCPGNLNCECKLVPGLFKLACKIEFPNIKKQVCKISLDHPFDFSAYCY